MKQRSLMLHLMTALILTLAFSHAMADNESSVALTAETPRQMADAPELWQLDWSVRSKLPEFKVTGWLASDEAEKRFARIDGEVYVEGDELDNGLRLLEVHRNALIFMFQGETFRYYPR